MTNVRPSWDEYFLEIMDAVAKRSTCDRGRPSCVIAKDKRILSTGYGGSPVGLSHCDDAGHELHTVIDAEGNKTEHCIRTVHAELNAIVHAAKFGIPLSGATLYCNMTPCYTCAKTIINAGIVRVVAKMDYQKGQRSRAVFSEAGIEFEVVNAKVQPYGDQ